MKTTVRALIERGLRTMVNERRSADRDFSLFPAVRVRNPLVRPRPPGRRVPQSFTNVSRLARNEAR